MDKTSLTLGWLVGRQIAGQRRTQAETWETLFDGEVVTDETSGSTVFVDSIILSGAFAVGDRLRITANGVAVEVTAETSAYNNPIAGNPWLETNSGEDDGGDFLLLYVAYVFERHQAYFYTRNPGTYAVKVERLST